MYTMCAAHLGEEAKTLRFRRALGRKKLVKKWALLPSSGPDLCAMSHRLVSSPSKHIRQRDLPGCQVVTGQYLGPPRRHHRKRQVLAANEDGPEL